MEKDCVERIRLRDALYFANAITMRGVEIINRFPAAEAQTVVRCKDCRHRDPEDHKCDCGETERQGCPFKVSDDYFCAYGER